MPCHLVDHTLRSQNTQHRPTAARNLRPPSILDNARAKTQAHSLRLHDQQFLLRLNLQRDLGLSALLPAAQNRRVWRVCEEVFVAGEGGVGALGSDFT